MSNIFLKEKKITLNKELFFQISRSGLNYFALLKVSFKLFSDDYYFKIGLTILGDYFSFTTYWNRRMDHAGFALNLTVFGLEIQFNILDERHWDFVENNWKNTYLE